MERASSSGGMGVDSIPAGSSPETKSTSTQTLAQHNEAAPALASSPSSAEGASSDTDTNPADSSTTSRPSQITAPKTASSPPSLTLDTSTAASIAAKTNSSVYLAQNVTAEPFYPSVPYTPSSLSKPSTSPSSTRRRPTSQSPDRGADNARTSHGATNGTWTAASGGASRSSSSYRKPSFSSSTSPAQVAGLPSKPQVSLSTTSPDFVPQQYQHQHPVTNNPSMSVPSTPQFGRKVTRNQRTPSPTKASTSPQSAMSEPVKPSRSGVEFSGCMFETALSDSRRRMPYSLGVEKLSKEAGVREKLTADEEDKLTKQIEALVEKLQPTPEIESRRDRFVTKLEGIFNDTWPGHDIKVRTFGSTVNRLSSKDSDVDVCVTTEWDGLLPVCKVAKALDKAGMKRVVCVSAAKVPIVKISDPEFDVACDMNINNIGALENTRMIKTYVDIDPRVRPLAMVVKYWTKRRIINDAAGGGTLSSYTWTCMILNFLQTREPPILPSLHKTGVLHKADDGTIISFNDDIKSLRGFGSENKETLGGLLYAFFKKYGHDYDYDQSVISVRDASIKPKKDTSWFYIQNNRLCIEEPFNTTRNLGNTADDTSIRGLHLELRRACRILAEGVDLDKCCEQYVFPPEPTRESIPSGPSLHNHSVRISAVPSSRGRGGGGYGARGRSYGGYGRQGFRRSSNGQQYYQQQQQQLYESQNFYYAQPTPEQFYSALVQAQQLQLYQQTQAAHARVQAQLQAQQSALNQERGATTPQHEMPQNMSQLPTLMPYAAYTLGFPPFFYAPHIQQDNSQASSSVPASPPITPNVPDMRIGVGRGRRSFTASRSRSQPPTNGYPQSMPATYGRQPTMNPSDDEYDYGDLSSNGSINQHVLHRSSQPETPPDDEMSDEYAGFIIGTSGVFQPDIDPQQLHAHQEAYGTQKSYAERQKRMSSEKLPSPLLDRRKMNCSPSPLVIETDIGRRPSPSPLGNASRDGYDNSDMRAGLLYRDVAVGSPSSQSSLAGEDNRMSHMPDPSDLPYAIRRHVDLVHANELRNVRSSPALSAYTSQPLTGATLLSPLTDAASALRHLSDEGHNNSRLSPHTSRRQNNNAWKSHNSASDMRKMKSRNVSHEDLASPLTSIPESSSQSRKGSHSTSPAKSHSHHHSHHGHTNGSSHHHNHHHKERSSEHQPPPTPASDTPSNSNSNSNSHRGNNSSGRRKQVPHPLTLSTIGIPTTEESKKSAQGGQSAGGRAKGAYSKVNKGNKKKKSASTVGGGEEKKGG